MDAGPGVSAAGYSVAEDRPSGPAFEEVQVQLIRRQAIRRQALDGHPRLDGRAKLEQATERPTGPATEYPLAMVEWHDAWFDLDQEDPDDCRSDYVVRTVGFLVADGPSVLSLAQEILPDGEGFRAVTHIPRPIVERVVRLGEREMCAGPEVHCRRPTSPRKEG